MKKILFGLLFVLCFFGTSMFANQLLFSNVYRYDLKNLKSDLKKDYTEEECLERIEKDEAPCNLYQLKNNDDTAVIDFITAIKKKDYKTASYITNASLTTMRSMFPHGDLHSAIAGFGSIPFYKGKGLLGLELHSHDSGFKFYYITIKNNILYMIKMDGTFRDMTNSMKDPFYMTIEARDKDGKVMSVFTLNDLSNTPNSSWFLKYLQKRIVSKDFDERRIAFEKKVVKYMSSIK